MTVASLMTPRRVRGRLLARWVLAFVYVTVGIFHIALPGPFLMIIPDWVPFPHQVILGTGVCEVAGAAGLLTKRFRWAAGVCLALYAVCVFPANIKHAIAGSPAGQLQLGCQVGWWYHGLRLAFQPVLVWWALFAGEAVTWPFGRSR